MLLGPFSILIAWLVYWVVYFKSDRTGHTTLSSVVASNQRNYWLFCIGLVASGIFFFVFARNWLVSELQLPRVFLYIVGIAALFFQSIIAVVPMKGKYKMMAHNVAAYGECTLMPVVAIFVAQSRALPMVVRAICWALVVFMLYLVVEFKRNFLKPRFIKVQAAFSASFHAIILLAIVTKTLN